MLLPIRILGWDMAYIPSADGRQASDIGTLKLHLVWFDYLVFLGGCLLHKLHPKIPVLCSKKQFTTGQSAESELIVYWHGNHLTDACRAKTSTSANPSSYLSS